MKVNNFEYNYWNYHEMAAWGYYFEDVTKVFNNEQEFLTKYILLTFKYGINIPQIITQHELDLDEYIMFLRKQMPKEKYIRWGSLIGLMYFSKEVNTRIYNCFMYVKNKQDETTSYIHKDPSYPQLFQLFGSKNDNLYSFYLELNSDAFFSKLENSKIKNPFSGIIVDNSDLAYLNTPRLNSFIRDLSNLMVEFGASKMEFSNLNEDCSIQESKFYKDNYLLIENEVIFFEDISELYPDNLRLHPTPDFYAKFLT